ncbi:amidase [Nesterenkonia alba]|uniref:amidase n=1 Tax=Nesterenkonia alba TaxID=515814 RepID=UPI0003B52A31|nr:amidase [Nesterenkonia alba]
MHTGSQQKTVTELHTGYRTGEFRVWDVLSELREHIETVEPTIGAWVSINWDDVDRQAAALPPRPTPETPLWGVPVGLKDNIDVEGYTTQAGCQALATNTPKTDSDVVSALRAAGAIILGKLTTTELAQLGNPPDTGNAWNPDHTPGGSSSGPGAATGAGMIPLSLGTQTRGSIGRPASFNGVFGLSPTQGRISTRGVVANAWTIDKVGPFARSAEDIKLALRVLETVPGVARFSPVARSGQHLPAAPRVGVLVDEYFQDCDGAGAAAVASYRSRLEDVGVEVVEVELPVTAEKIVEVHHIVESSEFGTAHRDLPQDQLGEYVAGIVETSRTISARDYLQAQSERNALHAAVTSMLSSHQLTALLTPGALGTAPEGRGATGSPHMSVPFTTLGLPALVRPSIVTDGLPCGVQLVGPSGTDAALVELGTIGGNTPLTM